MRSCGSLDPEAVGAGRWRRSRGLTLLSLALSLLAPAHASSPGCAGEEPVAAPESLAGARACARARRLAQLAPLSHYSLRLDGEEVGDATIGLRVVEGPAGAELELLETIRLAARGETWTTSCWFSLEGELRLERIVARRERAGASEPVFCRLEVLGRRLTGYRGTRRVLRQLPGTPICSSAGKLWAALLAGEAIGGALDFSGYEALDGEFEAQLRLVRVADSTPEQVELDLAARSSAGEARPAPVACACVQERAGERILASSWFDADGRLLAHESRRARGPGPSWVLLPPKASEQR